MARKGYDFDAIVIGGGPGGSCAAGFLAKSGLKVALFEREKFPRYHIGESLLPATTMGVLAKLGVKERVDSHGFTRKLGGTFLWGKAKEPWTFHFYRADKVDRKLGDHPEFLHSYQVRRCEFDALLLDHARSLGVEVHEERSLAALEGLDAPVKTALVEVRGGKQRRYRAPFVVDASGRNSIVRRLFGERHYDPFFKNVAVFGYFEGGKRMPGERKGNIFCAAFKHGWFWYIPLTDNLTSVGLVLGKDRYNELKSDKPGELLAKMIVECPRIAELLEQAAPCRQAPYDQIRTEVDFSYAHSEFSRNGVFLVGDAACFIDPVFSSGVHLATYSGYLAAKAVAQVRAGKAGLAEAGAEFERLYRREYMAFYRFLMSFYEMHKDTDSYFWAARKALARRKGSDHDSFISIVSGTATTGGKLFKSYDSFLDDIQRGGRSLETLVRKVSGIKVSGQKLKEAKDFMKPVHEGRKAIFKEVVQRS